MLGITTGIRRAPTVTIAVLAIAAPLVTYAGLRAGASRQPPPAPIQNTPGASQRSDTLEVELITVESYGFEPSTITRTKGPFTVTEHVDRENAEGGLDIVQNQRAMSPLKNGVFPDIVGIGEDSTKPFDRTNAKDVEHASNVIQTALQTPITDKTRQTLTVTGCNTTLTVVNERTQSNIDSATGKVRPFTSNGRLVNNYNYSIKVVSGPLRVGNR